jgi:hypothetical protein
VQLSLGLFSEYENVTGAEENLYSVTNEIFQVEIWKLVSRWIINVHREFMRGTVFIDKHGD